MALLRGARSRAQCLSVEPIMTAAVTTVVITGDLDVAVVPALADRLAEILACQPRRLAFDLERVGFLDCAAARVIIAAGCFPPAGQRPLIRLPSPAARRVLEITGLDGYCDVEPGRAR
jgi:anti-anti-sigma factor